jgi:aspartate/methionine/tyrosine aminotransferase
MGRRTLIQPLAEAAGTLGLQPLQPMLHLASSYFASVATMQAHIQKCRAELNSRIQVVSKKLKETELDYSPVGGTGYFWVKLRRRRISLNFARWLLRQKGILVAPGTSFGEEGEGWVRICANCRGEELDQAIEVVCRHIGPLKARLRRKKTL